MQWSRESYTVPDSYSTLYHPEKQLGREFTRGCPWTNTMAREFPLSICSVADLQYFDWSR